MEDLLEMKDNATKTINRGKYRCQMRGVSMLSEELTGLLSQRKYSLEMVTDAEHHVMRIIVYR